MGRQEEGRLFEEPAGHCQDTNSPRPVHTHTHTHTDTHTCTHVRTHARMHTRTHAYTHACTRAHTRTYLIAHKHTTRPIAPSRRRASRGQQNVTTGRRRAGLRADLDAPGRGPQKAEGRRRKRKQRRAKEGPRPGPVEGEGRRARRRRAGHAGRYGGIKMGIGLPYTTMGAGGCVCAAIAEQRFDEREREKNG